MKTITFYSYKGGVGRTLALSNIAKRLSEFGKKVCLLDFDLEAPGLHHKFRKSIQNPIIKKGIVDYIYEFSEFNSRPETLLDYVTKVKFQNINLQDIDLIAAGNTESKEYWRKLSSIKWNELFYEENSQGIALFIDLKERIKKELNPDFLLIDSRTGITDISGITMSVLADEVVLMAANNKENLEGTKQIINTLTIPENTFIQGIPKLNVVLSRVPYSSEPKEKFRVQNAKNHAFREINNYLKINKNSNFKLEKIFLIHSDPELELEEKFKIGYEHDKQNLDSNKPPIAIDYLELFQELTRDVLSETEREKFSTLRKTKVLIEQARVTSNKSTKIKLLKNAIELNPKSNQAYFDLANVYFDNGDYQKCLSTIKKALKINPSNLDYLYLKGLTYKNIDQLDEAEIIFLDILKKNKKHLGSLIQMGLIYHNNDKLGVALKYEKDLIKFHPDYDNGYNSISDSYRKMGKYDIALDYIYKALEINPQSFSSTTTLAEIHVHLGNKREFYKNLELAFTFGLNSEVFQEVIDDDEECIYAEFYKDKKFLEILDKYNIKIDFPEKE
ncbi:KGGVGR-motif variant AAA ATPase [Lacinutrix jangbogonensis]|uniref:KGGVGR-motif variant AAA ATPase n=1 Tax=Lacinutrix jangbogonensis TaxID=1469557 RepID=UPI00068AC0A0|nr:tetratricopeptide repeat protein [Lacinutrix jangbogonensis]